MPRPRQLIFAVTVFDDRSVNELTTRIVEAVGGAVITPVEYVDGQKVVGETQFKLTDDEHAALIVGRKIERTGDG
jgi:hypothetical protein